MAFSLLLLVLGCPSGDSTKPDDTAPSGDDTGGTTIPGQGDIGSLTVSSSDSMSTVLTVEFDTTEAATCQVVLGPSAGEYRYATAPDPEPVTSHAFLVPGFPAGVDYHWRVECEFESGDQSSPDAEYRARSAPGGLPDYDIEDVDLGASAGGYRIVPWMGEAQGGFLVVNAEGELVWWHETDEGEVALSVHQSPDGLGVYWNINDAFRETDISTIEYARWDLGDTRSIRTEWAHHDFALLPDGAGFTYIMADIRETQGETVVGDAIWRVELDGSNPREIWNGWDEIEEPNFRGCRPTFYPFACDWTHANNVYYEPGEDAYYVSFHEYNSFVRLDGMESGNTDWFLGSIEPVDYEPRSANDEFVHQHGVKPWPGEANTYVLFDNGSGNAGDTSRVVRVTHDGRNSYEVSWEHDFGDRYASILLGDTDPVGEDLSNTLISWGSEGIVTEITESQETVFRLNFGLGAAAGFVEWLPTMGGPI